LRFRQHLTYANVTASLAAFGVLAGGGAYAASKIGTEDIRDHAITPPKIERHAVTRAKIAPAAVSDRQLESGVAGVALAGAQVTETGAIRSWFNRLGDGPPQVGHVATGVWELQFAGLETLRDPFVGIATLSPTSNSLLTDPGEITARQSGLCSGTCTNHPVVNTFDSSGNPTDRGFTYVLYRGGESYGKAAAQ
jgi:hypothetical protein